MNIQNGSREKPRHKQAFNLLVLLKNSLLFGVFMKSAILVVFSILIQFYTIDSSAILKAMTDGEMSQVTGQIVSPSIPAHQATAIIEFIAKNGAATSILTNKINSKLKSMNLERVAEEAIREELLRTNSIAYSDVRYNRAMQTLAFMYQNKQIYDYQQLLDSERRAIVQGFINALVHSNLRGNPTLGNAVAVMVTLNPYDILQKYPNLAPNPKGNIVDLNNNPNSPNINVTTSR